ncbi:NLRC3 [Acrasis kona]|uniref:NLRC3 n=1 Tax=Acrasis kona TaxID=1008807 RepID=A0AAW2Z601_9EUKA
MSSAELLDTSPTDSNDVGCDTPKTAVKRTMFQESIEVQLQQNPTFLKFNYGLFSAQEMFQLTSTILTSPSCTVRYLDLIGNRLGDAGVNTIAESLKTNTTINYLNLSMNDISSDGVKNMCDVLSNKTRTDTNRSLEHLDLSINRLGDAGVACILEMLRNNDTLITINLRSNKVKSQQGVNCLLEIAALTKISDDSILKDVFV